MKKREPKAVKPRGGGRVMPDSERENIMEEIEAEKTFQAALGRGLSEDGRTRPFSGDELPVDGGKISRRIGNLNRALKDQGASELRGAARNAAIARHRHLKETLPELLMSLRDQDMFPRDGHDYATAVRKAKREIGDPGVRAQVEEFRSLGIRLWPNDPDQSSIERLRKPR